MQFTDEYKVSLQSITKELRKESLSVKNRLQSILYDAQYIQKLKEKNIISYPLVANERCGCWYVPAWDQVDTCYFKSTDGHTGYWKFSNRRTNLHLIPTIVKSGGLSIVDSTRKGKKLPDALLKTIPIWYAVLNYIRFEDELNSELQQDCIKSCGWFATPDTIISKSENSQIKNLIVQFVTEVKRLEIILKKKLIELGMEKPFLPKWIYNNQMDLPEVSQLLKENSYYEIECISASRTQNTPSFYVQGSADDHELWLTRDICEGNLDYKFLWNEVVNCNHLMQDNSLLLQDWIGDEELILKLNQLYESKKRGKEDEDEDEYLGVSKCLDISHVKNGENDTNLYFGQISGDIEYEKITQKYPQFNHIVILSDKFDIKNVPDQAATGTTIKVQQFKLPDNKVGSKKLREVLPQIKFGIDDNCKLVLCNSGKDLSASVILMTLCTGFDYNWKRVSNPQLNKDNVKKQLSLLQEVRKINPCRNSLQSVNSFILR